jgi:sn-glycerol 3-phosphate transport system permease protein
MSASFPYRKIGYFFILPQLIITLAFFIWPAVLAFQESFFYSDPFGVQKHFAGLNNYFDVFTHSEYGYALFISFLLAFCIILLTMSTSIILAWIVNARTRSYAIYKSLFLWPYAIAPAVAAILWGFLFHPVFGLITYCLSKLGISFNYLANPRDALLVIVITASWQQFSYNFLFYLLAIKNIPSSIREAAVMDGASNWQILRQIYFPLLAPTSFFLLIMNFIYASFDIFGIIHVLTSGGPERSTTTLVYKIYQDGIINMDTGSAAAQSVILMLITIGLTILQFKYVERKVHYQ